MKHVVVVGAGIGGLTGAAVLARAGVQVTVLEAHVYPGGCAGTFYHQGYRFDAGATLAGGFYPGGPMDRVGRAAGIADWEAHPADPAMVIHLPDGRQMYRGSYVESAPAGGESRRADGHFWKWQRQTASRMWALALRVPAWPPQSLAQSIDLARDGISWLASDSTGRLSLGIVADAFRPAAHRLRDTSDELRMLVDAQLLISAQATSESANALYAAAALDLPHRGVAHLKGGMGAIADRLVDAIRRAGGSVYYRRPVKQILMERGRAVGVKVGRGETILADAVLANLTPWNIRALLQDHVPRRLKKLPDRPDRGWGAFMVYAGIDGCDLPDDFPLHHQVIVGRPMGEGNTAFLSLSPAWDAGRAPQGRRALTVSTHTALAPWWELYEHDRLGYEAYKQRMSERLIQAAERALPGIRERASLILPGTPVTFERFTQRARGWVGGFPQTSLFHSWGPRLAKNLWMVGDSIFPGQSTAAAALGGLRVAGDMLNR